MPVVPNIIGLAGSYGGQRVPIPAQGLRIGRLHGLELVLDEQGVSRQHANLALHQGALWIQDLGSRNGVFVNDRRIQGWQQLQPGDRIRIGGSLFEVELPEAPTLPGHQHDPASAPRRRPWVLLVPIFAGLAALVIVLLVIRAGRDPAPIPVPTHQDSIGSLLRSTPVDAEQVVPPAPPTLDLQPAPTPASPPPDNMTAPELVDQAHAYYDAKRWQDALTSYDHALQLDPSCAICISRIDRIHAHVQSEVSNNLAAGQRYYGELRVDEAVDCWERVLLLDPDPSSPTHMQALGYLEQARGR